MINANTGVNIQVKGATKGRPSISRITKKKAAAQAEDSENADEAEDATTIAAQLEKDPLAEVNVSVTSDGETTTQLPASKQYVNLTDILPPLPAKGDFSVETIKKSLYFFS